MGYTATIDALGGQDKETLLRSLEFCNAVNVACTARVLAFVGHYPGAKSIFDNLEGAARRKAVEVLDKLRHKVKPASYLLRCLDRAIRFEYRRDHAERYGLLPAAYTRQKEAGTKFPKFVVIPEEALDRRRKDDLLAEALLEATGAPVPEERAPGLEFAAVPLDQEDHRRADEFLAIVFRCCGDKTDQRIVELAIELRAAEQTAEDVGSDKPRGNWQDETWAKVAASLHMQEGSIHRRVAKILDRLIAELESDPQYRQQVRLLRKLRARRQAKRPKEIQKPLAA